MHALATGLRRLFWPRDRVVFVTTRKRAATQEYEAKRAEVNAKLRRVVARGRAIR